MIEPTTLARPYARAAFQFAVDNTAVDVWYEALQVLTSVVAEPNVARILGMLWDNTPDNPNLDCMQDASPYWKDSCFRKLDQNIKRATDNGVWVILTGRS